MYIQIDLQLKIWIQYEINNDNIHNNNNKERTMIMTIYGNINQSSKLTPIN